MTSGRISCFGENKREKSREIVDKAGQSILKVGAVLGSGILFCAGLNAFNSARE